MTFLYCIYQLRKYEPHDGSLMRRNFLSREIFEIAIHEIALESTPATSPRHSEGLIIEQRPKFVLDG
jgi:hypothetical protein